MKKYLGGLTAIALAVAATAFTTPRPVNDDTVYDWLEYDASGNPTSTFLEDKTEDQVRAANPQCNGSNTTCFEAYNQAHTSSEGILIQKP